MKEYKIFTAADMSNGPPLTSLPAEVITDDEEDITEYLDQPSKHNQPPLTPPRASESPLLSPAHSSKPVTTRETTASDDSDEELQCTVVWDSSKTTASVGSYSNNDSIQSDVVFVEALQLKDQGNQKLKAGDFSGALDCYKQASKAFQNANENSLKERSEKPLNAKRLEAVIHSNMSAALIKLCRYQEAVSEAQTSHKADPSWSKPLYRLAEAHLKLKEYKKAVIACKVGETLCKFNSGGHSEFTSLLDKIAVEGALIGDLSGFDGRELEVRSAGDDAWLGKPAPYDPVLDGPFDEETSLPSDDLSAIKSAAMSSLPTSSSTTSTTPGALLPVASRNVGTHANNTKSTDNNNKNLTTWNFSSSIHTSSSHQKLRTSFRSIKEAVKAAKDGDRILLRKGIHNGMGESIDITKRIFIQGEGQLGETVIDQRANCPTFRILRSGAVIRNVDMDHTGFREAVLVTGNASEGLIDNCIIKCSGDDAINTSSLASITFRNCRITGKKAGVRAFDSSKPKFDQCLFEKCGEQGVKAMESSSITLDKCIITECDEDGVVVMDTASVKLTRCVVHKNKGPGIDCTAHGKCTITQGIIKENVGGVWLWDSSQGILNGVEIHGGPSQVVLVDDKEKNTAAAKFTAKNCVIKGTVHASDIAWQGLLGNSILNNRLLPPDNPTDFPPEEGPFKFIPNKYTRKQ